MATSTFAIACPAGAWTLIADGATYNAISLEVPGNLGVLLAVAASAPAVGSPDYIAASAGGPLLPIALGATDKLYAFSQGAPTTVRGLRVSVA